MPNEAAAPPPLVVALIGLPGAGKSEVARHLAHELGLRIVSRDAVRAAMFPACSYTLAEKRAAFRAVLTALEVNCALRASSVIDGMTFARRADLERVRERCAGYGASVLAIWLDVPPHVARARVARDVARGGHPAGDRDAALVDSVQRDFEPPGPDVPAVDAALPLAELCARVTELVTAHRAPDAGTQAAPS